MVRRATTRRKWRATREGLVLALLAGCILASSFVQNVNLLVLVSVLLAAPLFAALIRARWNLAGLEVERRLPVDIHAGEPIRVLFRIRNGTRRHRAYQSWIADSVPGGVTARLALDSMPPGSVQEVAYRMLLPRRGKQALGPARLVSRFPFGVAEMAEVVLPSDTCIVLPTLGRLTPAWFRDTGLAADVRAGSRRRLASQLFELLGLREYREGDNPRHVHWRTSARAGRLMVKEFDAEPAADLLLVLDAWQPTGSAPEEYAPLERAVSMVATAVAAMARIPEAKGTLLLLGRSIEVARIGTGTILARAAMQHLAVAVGRPGEIATEDAVRLQHLAQQHARTWIISSFPNQKGSAGPAEAARATPRWQLNLHGRRLAERIRFVHADSLDLDRWIVWETSRTEDGLNAPKELV